MKGMTMHTTKVVKTEQTNNESLAVTIRCCGNEKTDSVLTINEAYKRTREQIESMVEQHHDSVKARCAGMQTALQNLQSLTNLTKEHTEPSNGIVAEVETAN